MGDQDSLERFAEVTVTNSRAKIQRPRACPKQVLPPGHLQPKKPGLERGPGLWFEMRFTLSH